MKYCRYNSLMQNLHNNPYVTSYFTLLFKVIQSTFSLGKSTVKGNVNIFVMNMIMITWFWKHFFNMRRKSFNMKFVVKAGYQPVNSIIWGIL